MCAPAAPVILDHFNSTNHAYQVLLVSIWELGEVFGPFLLASCSELYGRLPVYHGATVLLILFSVACAASTSLPMLLAFRFLIGMTPPTGTLNAPIIADMFPKEQRGRAISMMQLPGLIGTVAGPTIGSFVTDARGWRWTFWLAAILCGAFECVFAVFYRETYRVRILKDRVEKLKKETANPALRSRYDTGKRTGQVFHEAMIRPFKMLAFSPVIPILGFYAALVYGYLFLILTTVGQVFMDTYRFSERSVGLTYLGIGKKTLSIRSGGKTDDHHRGDSTDATTGTGMMVGILGCRSTLDRYLKHRVSRSGTAEAEDRLPPMVFGGLVLPAGLFMYGWSAATRAHYIVPIVATGVCGFGLTTTTIPASTYLVDAFGIHAASAVAATNALKYALGTVLPLAGPPLYERLGLGWGNSVLGFVALGMVPIPLFLMRFGGRLRKRSSIKVED
ncbi:MAG: hypothetical protein Q9207_006671 [Kuettlingeria erythrocarpa]